MCRTENVPLTKYLGANENLKDLNEENVAGSFFFCFANLKGLFRSALFFHQHLMHQLAATSEP